MSERQTPQLLYGLGALAVALAIGLVAISISLKDIRSAGDQVAVTGSAKRTIRSDFAVWRSSIATQSADLAEASAQLSRNGTRVRAFFREQGIADSLVIVRPIETYGIPEIVGEGRETGRILAYRLTQTYEVRSPDVDGITKLTQQASSLIAQGIPLGSQPPEYLYTKLADIRVQLLEEATADAKLRAEAIARSTGADVGTVREARMGVFQITPRYSTEVSDYGVNDVTSIEKDVQAVVRVTFALR
jgi:uncharacterized protein